MTTIALSEYINKLSALPILNEKNLSPYKDIGFSRTNDTDYFISWGDPAHKIRTGIMETGFLWDACHIDTIGLYAAASLNSPSAAEMIASYKAPVSAQKLVLEGKLPKSKYRQPPRSTTRWRGVVLALQNPSDRSIHRGSSSNDYYDFVEQACKKYTKHLFLKLHPWNAGEVEARIRAIAERHGCTVGRAGHSVLKYCKFVLVYNSTFVVDCFLREIKVAQFAPGYFWQSKALSYTSGEFPDDVSTDTEAGLKLCDFLVWKYLIRINMPIDRWVDVIRLFSTSRLLFPLTEELSYASNLE